jgi:hypothetical protein
VATALVESGLAVAVEKASPCLPEAAVAMARETHAAAEVAAAALAKEVTAQA